MLPEDGETERVEGVDRDSLPGARRQGSQALAHLAGRPPGEGDREAPVRRNASVRDEVGDAMGEGPGLSGARPRHDEQWPRGDLGCSPLVRIEPGQDAAGIRDVARTPIRASVLRNEGVRPRCLRKPRRKSGQVLPRRRAFGPCRGVRGPRSGSVRGRARRGPLLTEEGCPPGEPVQLLVLEQANRAVHPVVPCLPDHLLAPQAGDRLGDERRGRGPDVLERERVEERKLRPEPAEEAFVVPRDTAALRPDLEDLGQDLG